MIGDTNSKSFPAGCYPFPVRNFPSSCSFSYHFPYSHLSSFGEEYIWNKFPGFEGSFILACHRWEYTVKFLGNMNWGEEDLFAFLYRDEQKILPCLVCQGWWAVHWLARSVGRKRAGKVKHAGIFAHDPADALDQRTQNIFFDSLKTGNRAIWSLSQWPHLGALNLCLAAAAAVDYEIEAVTKVCCQTHMVLRVYL